MLFLDPSRRIYGILWSLCGVRGTPERYMVCGEVKEEMSQGFAESERRMHILSS